MRKIKRLFWIMLYRNQFVYQMDCYCGFFGDNSLTDEQQLFCPECEQEWSIDSIYVQKIQVLYKVENYKLRESNELQ